MPDDTCINFASSDWKLLHLEKCSINSAGSFDGEWVTL